MCDRILAAISQGSKIILNTERTIDRFRLGLGLGLGLGLLISYPSAWEGSEG